MCLRDFKTESTKLYNYTFTVFTPTYNRGHTLHRVYSSLEQQTLHDFEWLIVDDGSVDNTRELVEAWKREASFPIRYIYQENQGKHIAFNRGVQAAKGELFLTLDSDDACVPEALERFKYHWDSIPEDKRNKFSAVTSLCVDQYGKLVGTKFPYDVTDSDSLEVRYKFKVKGEKWGFHRTAVLLEHQFPETVKQHYLPEGLVWNNIARKYKTRFINECLRIYFIEQSSMMRGQRPEKNSIGGRAEHLFVLNDQTCYFKYAPLDFCRSAMHYARFSFHLETSVLEQVERLNNWLARVLWVTMLPIGFLFYLSDKKGFEPRRFVPWI